MKRKFEELRENLEEFVEQTEFPMMVVGCLGDELAYVVKFFQSLEETHKEAYFVVFPHPFTGASAYVDGIVDNVRTQIDGAQHLRAERGEPPFPPLPKELADSRRPPEERLRRVLAYLRSLLPDEADHYVAVGLLPLECADYEGYCQLVETVMPAPDVQPWMVPLRIVACDDRLRRGLFAHLADRKLDKVLTYEVDFSTPALTDTLTRDAADATLPVAERMGCLMQLASIDYAYQRFPDALEKYGVLYKYYEGIDIPSMQALCVLGAGDTLRAGGQGPAAKEMLQRGLALAMKAKALPILINLLLSITDLSTELGHHADAESYADSGSRVAAGSLSPFAYADFHEKKANAQMAQGKIAEGLATYQRCEELCKMYEYHRLEKAVLEKQIKFYETSAMTRERREAEHRLAMVHELERSGGRSGAPDGQPPARDSSHKAAAAGTPAKERGFDGARS